MYVCILTFCDAAHAQLIEFYAAFLGLDGLGARARLADLLTRHGNKKLARVPTNNTTVVADVEVQSYSAVLQLSSAALSIGNLTNGCVNPLALCNWTWSLGPVKSKLIYSN